MWTDKAQVMAMVDRTVGTFGRVDVLVNNAWGGGSFSRLEHKTDADLQQALNVAVFGAFWAMQAAYPHMRRQGGGRIITLCSLNGVNAHMFTAEYNSAKEALRALTRTAAREWGRHNILANIICPAAATAPYELFRQFDPDNAAALLRQNPLGRDGRPGTRHRRRRAVPRFRRCRLRDRQHDLRRRRLAHQWRRVGAGPTGLNPDPQRTPMTTKHTKALGVLRGHWCFFVDPFRS
jgi:NAD(P)-dependent dehydrogenase (short-subunit alcohol dehydrogenase family)